MTINEAIEFFTLHKQMAVVKKLRPLQDVGLGYIKLGQSSATLSGGENQRVKLAYYLSQEKPPRRSSSSTNPPLACISTISAPSSRASMPSSNADTPLSSSSITSTWPNVPTISSTSDQKADATADASWPKELPKKWWQKDKDIQHTISRKNSMPEIAAPRLAVRGQARTQ